jgi:O-antigen/teichoic acid export membrane protein
MLFGSGLYSVALFAPNLASIILVPVMTRSLTRADYGITDLLAQIGSVLNLLLGMNFSAALGYFYFGAETGEARRNVVGTSIVGSAVIGLAAVLVCLPFTAAMARLVFPHVYAERFLDLVVVSMLPSFLLEALTAWLRIVNRPGMYVGISLARLAVTIAGIVVLVGVAGLRVWGVLWTAVAAVLVHLAFLLVIWLRSGPPSFDRHLFIRMLKYAFPLGLAGVAMFVLNCGDRFILPHYRPFDDLGIYALACKAGILMSALYGSFQVYWGAQVFGIMKREDAGTVFPRILTYVVGGTSFFGLFLCIFAQPAIRILAAPLYYRAAALVPILVAAFFLRSIGDFVRSLLLVAGRPRDYAICNWIGAAVCIGGYALLIPIYGIWGAAAATVGAFGVIGFVSAVWSYRAMPYRVESRRLAKIGIAVAAALLARWLPSAATLTAQIGWGTVAMALFPLTLWVLRFPTAGEKRLGRAAIETLIRVRAAGVSP